MEDYRSKRTGEQIEALLDIVSQGGGGGGEGGGTITEAEITAMGFTKNLGTITEVKMNGASKGTDGVVDLGTVITQHQDISGKQDTITDLAAIREGASKGATALQSVPSEYITETELNGKGYLTAVPSEYVTETELTNKGYATSSQLSSKADLENGKIKTSQLPDYILGQVMFGGTVEWDGTRWRVEYTQDIINKFPDIEMSETLSWIVPNDIEGVYFICVNDGDESFDANSEAIPTANTGDWLISNGEHFIKIDNTDAVSSVAGLTGAIDAYSLGRALSYNDLKDKPTIPSAVTESTVSGWGFTKNTGTYSKPSGGIPKSDLASAVQTSLGKADTALQSYTEQYKGTVTGVKVNGSTKSPSSGIVDIGTVITSHQDISGKQDKLVSGTNLKTINGQSLLGSGDITIEGGGGGGSSEGGGMKIVNCGSGFIEIDAAEPNTIYVSTHNDTSGGLGIYGFIPPTEAYAEYIFIFQIGIVPSGLDVPEFVLWPNGVMPELPAPTAQQGTTKFELNISASLIEGGSYIYKAVLTHFKEIEW